MVCSDFLLSSVTFMYPKYQEISRIGFSVKSTSLRPWDYSLTHLNQTQWNLVRDNRDILLSVRDSHKNTEQQSICVLQAVYSWFKRKPKPQVRNISKYMSLAETLGGLFFRPPNCSGLGLMGEINVLVVLHSKACKLSLNNKLFFLAATNHLFCGKLSESFRIKNLVCSKFWILLVVLFCLLLTVVK